MEIIQRQADSNRVIEITGRLDIRVAPVLKESLSQELGNSTARLVVDLLRVEFIDSSALGVLVGIHRDAERNAGKLLLVSPEGPARQIFTLSRTDQLLNLYDSLEEALACA